MKKALFFALGISFVVAGCRHPKSPAELEAGLDSPEPEERRHAADGLRDGDEVPPEAIPKLLAAADKETDPQALGAELITLGTSGVPDAKPRICKKFGDGDVRMSRWANHAMQAWQRKNPGQPGCTGGDSSSSYTAPVGSGGAAPAPTPTGSAAPAPTSAGRSI